jgi:hypothetical protein
MSDDAWNVQLMDNVEKAYQMEDSLLESQWDAEGAGFRPTCWFVVVAVAVGFVCIVLVPFYFFEASAFLLLLLWLLWLQHEVFFVPRCIFLVALPIWALRVVL